MYLGVFLAAFLLAQTNQRRQRFGEGIAIALALVAILALATAAPAPRLQPSVRRSPKGRGCNIRSATGTPTRSSSPSPPPCCLWMSRRSLSRALRWFSVGALPAVLLALYFTHSRGGVLTLIVARRDPGRPLARPPLVPGDAADRRRTDAAGDLPDPLLHRTLQQLRLPPDRRAGAQGRRHPARRIAVTLLACWALRRLERRDSPPVKRALAISRDRRVLRGIAIAGLVALRRSPGSSTATPPGTSSPAPTSGVPSGLAEASSRGRAQFWDVAARSLRRKADPRPRRRHLPVRLGPAAHHRHAATRRPTRSTCRRSTSWGSSAPSSPSAWCCSCSGPASRPGAPPAAASASSTRSCSASASPSRVGAAYDWFWQLAVIGSVFFMATGILVAARCGQLWRARAAARAREGRRVETNGESRRFGLTIAGLAVAWLTMLALTGPLLVDHEIHASTDAARGTPTTSKAPSTTRNRPLDRALGGDAVPAARPARRRRRAIIRRRSAASARPSTARTTIGRSITCGRKAEHLAGQNEAAQNDLNEAKRLNPLETCLTEGFEGCG